MQGTHSEHSASSGKAWWQEPSSGWERVKEALRRDWEQTKADFGEGETLDQSIGDTLRQALGREPIPAEHVPNQPAERWEDVEEAMRYGYTARRHFTAYPDWDEALEARLREDWDSMSPPRTWHDVRQFVHRGWMGP